MAPPSDVGLTVLPVSVTDWDFNNPQVQLCSTEKEVEVPKGIKIAKVMSIRGNAFVVGLPQGLRSA